MARRRSRKRDKEIREREARRFLVVGLGCFVAAALANWSGLLPGFAPMIFIVVGIAMIFGSLRLTNRR